MGTATARAGRGGPPSVPHERRSADGSEGSRNNGFVPRELTHDEFGMPRVVDDGDAAPTGYIPNGAAYGTNGSANGASYWATGPGYGPWPEEPAVHDVPLNRADDHPSQANGMYANGTHVNSGYVNGAYADGGVCRRGVCRRGVCRRGVCRRGYQDDSSPPAWPSLGAYGYGRSGSGSSAYEPSTGAGSIADGVRRLETSWHGPERPVGHDRPVGYDRPFGPDREPGAGREFGADRDHVAGAGSDPDLWIEATAWASVVGSGAAPAAEVADVGADDWTVPMPVVRAAPVPEPEPVRPEPVRRNRPTGRRPTPGAPRAAGVPAGPPRSGPPGRRAAARPSRGTRAVASRSAGRTSSRGRSGPSSGWEAAGMSARGEPDRGAHASDRPRHGGHRAAEPGDDPTGRAARRHASAHGRHSEERDDVAGADRPRHRRPEH